MLRYRVRSGQSLAHGGQVLPEGTVLELPPRVAAEIPHLVDEVDAEGRVLETPTPAWRIAADEVRAFERVGVLEKELERARRLETEAADRLTEAEAAITSRTTDLVQARRVVTDIENAIRAASAPPAPAEIPKDAKEKPASKSKSPSAPSAQPAAPSPDAGVAKE